MTRKSARDMAFKLIYQADIQKEDFDSVFSVTNEEVSFDDKSRDYILDVLNGINQNSDEINNIISENLKGWKLNRISKISLACIKLGIYEIAYNDDIPNTVAINEAVNLAKTYEGEEAAKFVNGILSVVLKEKE